MLTGSCNNTFYMYMYVGPQYDRVPYLDTYEDDWPTPGEEAIRTPTKEEIFLSYLAFHHPFLAEDPDYLRRVNSVEVLFQENTDPSDDAPDIIGL